MLRPTVAILGVFATCAACAPAHGPERDPGPRSREIRLLVPPVTPVSGLEAGTWPERLHRDRSRAPLVRVGVDGTLVSGLASGWSRRSSEEGWPCWRFRLRDDLADAIVEDWSARLSRGDDALARLFVGVRGTPLAAGSTHPEGLFVSGTKLWVCTVRSDPNVPFRLSHPAAWPFVDGRLPTGVVAEPLSSDEASEPERAVARRRAVAAFGADRTDVERHGIAVRRAPAWTATWALWLNPSARWTSDPSFRAWLANAIDRADLVNTVAVGQADVAVSLIGDPEATLPEPPSVRPFSSGARPRLTIAYEESDRIAEALLSRLKAKLRESNVTVDLDPSGRLPFEAIGDGREPSAILFMQLPAFTDDALALYETLSGLGPSAAHWTERLAARPFDDVEARTMLARAVQWDLTSTARLVPLVRAEAAILGESGALRPVPGGRVTNGGER